MDALLTALRSITAYLFDHWLAVTILFFVGVFSLFGSGSLGEGPLARTRRRVQERLERELRKREVEAAERAARWATWAAIIALAALALAAWQYLRPPAAPT
jgi:ABC-type Na+ efflux pump permease subunit